VMRRGWDEHTELLLLFVLPMARGEVRQLLEATIALLLTCVVSTRGGGTIPVGRQPAGGE
jgi:hypothetical protein